MSNPNGPFHTALTIFAVLLLVAVIASPQGVLPIVVGAGLFVGMVLGITWVFTTLWGYYRATEDTDNDCSEQSTTPKDTDD